jgi:hypothetical protein
MHGHINVKKRMLIVVTTVASAVHSESHQSSTHIQTLFL